MLHVRYDRIIRYTAYASISCRCGANAAVLFASDLIEHDGDDLPDLPLIDRKRRLAELIGKAKRAITRDGQTVSQKLETAQYALPLPARLSTLIEHDGDP